MATVIFFHAHPDDEAIATGGTMAGLSDAGHRVVLVTATRGDLGEIPEGLLDPGETLAERRTDELVAAGLVLGVRRQVWLDYLDSGMEGEDTNSRPGCFAAGDVEEAARSLAGVLAEESADVLVVYDEHGGYGHPDHIQVHRVGMRAAELAGTPGVYMSTLDRDHMTALMSGAGGSEWAPPAEELEGMETMGEPSARITTEVDVTPHIRRKRDAMRAHASQISETSFFLAMPEDVFEQVWGHEWYIRMKPAFVGAPDGEKEKELWLGPVPGSGAPAEEMSSGSGT